MAIEITRVSKARAELGEGPVWDAKDGCLWWVDITGGRIHRLDPESGAEHSFDWGEALGCVAVRAGGGLVVAAASGFWLFDPESGERTPIHDPESHLPHTRFNDGTVDPMGRFWAGTMSEAGTPEGSFYRLDPDLTVTRWRGGFRTTNGLAFPADGSALYFSDSHPEVRRIWRAEYDLSTGTPSELEPFFDTSAVAGRPDGGAVDAEGCYWQAGVSGGELYRLSPEGEVLLTLPVPVSRPTKIAFGGADMEDIFLSSIQPAPDAPEEPEAGFILRITGLGIRGLPTPRFAG